MWAGSAKHGFYYVCTGVNSVHKRYTESSYKRSEEIQNMKSTQVLPLKDCHKSVMIFWWQFQVIPHSPQKHKVLLTLHIQSVDNLQQKSIPGKYLWVRLTHCELELLNFSFAVNWIVTYFCLLSAQGIFTDQLTLFCVLFLRNRSYKYNPKSKHHCKGYSIAEEESPQVLVLFI